MIKRLFDIVAAALGLVLLAPVLIVVALLIRRKLGVPVLFVQPRVGLNGRVFRLVKFRTMLDAVDAEGRPLPDSQRLTPFGERLRRLSLDELPELWNVLKGDMSLVGPRPLLIDYLKVYTPRQARRHEVPPGITGLAQVSGRNAASWAQRLELDVHYVEHRSFLLDLKLLALTMWKVCTREGISAEGHATMPRLDELPRPHP